MATLLVRSKKHIFPPAGGDRIGQLGCILRCVALSLFLLLLLLPLCRVSALLLTPVRVAGLLLPLPLPPLDTW